MLGPFLLLLILTVLGITAREDTENNTAEPISGRKNTENTILPADVLSRVILFRDSLEQIRIEMGKPSLKNDKLDVSNVSPREVYFQALVMFRKADRLSYAWTSTKKNEPKKISEVLIKPYHVFRNVNAAHDRIVLVKNKFNITEKIYEKVELESTTATDVFIAIMAENRRLNMLLDRKIEPSDVYEQVDLIINYVKQLLLQNTILKKPKYINKKSPSDVYYNLYECFLLIENIFTLSNKKIMKIKLNKSEVANKTPSDVYDFTIVLLSEVSYLNSLKNTQYKADAIKNNDKMLPSHVFQHVSYLKMYLELLLQETEESLHGFK